MPHFIVLSCLCKSHFHNFVIVFFLATESCSSASLTKVSVKAMLFFESCALHYSHLGSFYWLLHYCSSWNSFFICLQENLYKDKKSYTNQFYWLVSYSDIEPAALSALLLQIFYFGRKESFRTPSWINSDLVCPCEFFTTSFALHVFWLNLLFCAVVMEML